MKRFITHIIFFCLAALLFGCAGVTKREHSPNSVAVFPSYTIQPTVFMVEENGQLCQLIEMKLPPDLSGKLFIEALQSGRNVESTVQVEQGATSCSFLAPACDSGSCPTTVTIKNEKRSTLYKRTFTIPYQRRWSVYISPFSHIDVGFTNCQRKILAQNIDNLRVALDLIEETKNYPSESRFQFFCEESWPLYEFLYSDTTTPAEKERMVAAMRSGTIEPGVFIISHQNKFMPAEALFRSTEWALQINRDFDVPIQTGCLNDLMDLSAVVKPLDSAGIPYFIGGPNTSRYIAPPLFYLKPPIGKEKVLAWITPNLNGYGENFDFAMRPDLPLTDEALAEIQSRLGKYLKSLEFFGSPPMNVREHFDFYGASWPYPYDMYFLPFYPAHAVDNGPQDITASEITRAWNESWAWPRLVLSNPAEFFSQAQEKYGENIPTIRGELPGFWGEQVYLALAQVDPGKESLQREFERKASAYEMAAASALLQGISYPDLTDDIRRAYKYISLNNDHNPGPVPFGHTRFTEEDVCEWKDTRRQWIADISNIGNTAYSQIQSNSGSGKKESQTQKEVCSALDQENVVILENEFYRVEVEKKTGGITSLFDKELERELASREGEYLLNQYVVVARGENAGVRGNLFTRPGFSRVKTEIISSGPDCASVHITGRTVRNSDQIKVMATFVKTAVDMSIPGFVLKAVVPFIGVKIGKVNEVHQEIELCSGDKAVHFIQHFKLDRDQLIDHSFVYPFCVPAGRPLIVEGPYSPYRFQPGEPFNTGDLIPGALMIDTDFPGINDMTGPFGWIYGMPADAVFRSYVLATGDDFGIAFSSKDSGLILPGPLEKDPVHGPFGGGFSHVAVGPTFYGNFLLGAPRQAEYSCRSALTSFATSSIPDAKARAARFGQEYSTGDFKPMLPRSSNPDIIIASLRKLNEKTLLFRLYEASGTGGQTTISLPTDTAITHATRARVDGIPEDNGKLMTQGSSFTITLAPGEIATVSINLP